MPGPISGATHKQPATNTPQPAPTEDVRQDPPTAPKAPPRAAGKLIDLAPKGHTSEVRNLLDTGRAPVTQLRTSASADMDARDVDRVYLNDLAKKSPAELEAWNEKAPDAVKNAVKRELGKIDATTLSKDDRRSLTQLGNRLNELQTKSNRDWAVRTYGNMTDKELMMKLANTPAKQIAEDLQNLSTGDNRAAQRVRTRMVQALETGMQTRAPRRNPNLDIPLIEPWKLKEAALQLRGPGAATVKAELAGAMYRKTHAQAERMLPDPEKPKSQVLQAVYEKELTEVREKRAAFVQKRLVRDASTYKELMMSDPSGMVREMENMSRRSGNEKLMPDVFIALAKSEYAEDPKKGGEILGKIVGAVAKDYARVVSEKDPSWSAGKARGNDLGAALASAEIAIASVAKSEKEKVAFGAKVIGFAVDTLKDSGIPGAKHIGEMGGKAMEWQRNFEEGKVDDWRRGIQDGFGDIVKETYDNVGYYRDYPPESEKGRIHEEGQDIYETSYQRKYEMVKDAYR